MKNLLGLSLLSLLLLSSLLFDLLGLGSLLLLLGSLDLRGLVLSGLDHLRLLLLSKPLGLSLLFDAKRSEREKVSTRIKKLD